MATDLWYTSCPLPNALSLAVYTGQLSHALAPLDVTLHSLRRAATPAERLSHFRHTVPGQVRHGGHIPPLWSRAEGRDVRLLGLSWTRESQLVLALPGSGLTEIGQLRGRRLAVPIRPQLPIDFWQAAVLKGWQQVAAAAGIGAGEVELVPVPVTTPASRGNSNAAWTLSAHRDEALALLAGQVDAIFSPAHYGVPLRAFLGLQTLFDLTAATDRLTHLNNATLLAVTMDGRLLDARPEIATRLLAGLLRAAAFAPRNQRETGRVIASDTGNAEELVPEIFGADFAEGLEPALDDEALQALESQGAFLHAKGFLPRVPPLDEWVERAPLEAVRNLAGGAAVEAHA